MEIQEALVHPVRPDSKVRLGPRVRTEVLEHLVSKDRRGIKEIRDRQDLSDHPVLQDLRD